MSISVSSAPPAGNNVLKGTVDAALAANLPSDPATGDRWRIVGAGTFENDALITPASYSFTDNDSIEWNGSAWMARDSGEDVWITGGTITGITDLTVADGGTGASDAAGARTNLDVYSKAETDNEIDTDIATHNAVTTAHGISTFGATLVDDADAPTARTTLDVDSKAEVDSKIDADINTHNAVTTAHGISAFGSTLVDDADAATARTTLDVDSKAEVTTKVSDHNAVTQAHGISAFGSTLVDDADAAAARTTLGAEPTQTAASQAEMEAGTVTATRSMTPQRVAQAIAALASGSGGGISWSVPGASPQTATSGNGYLIDTSSATYTLNLPATPTAGDEVHVTDAYGTASNYNITVGRNGSNIDSVASDLIINVNKASVRFVYVDATVGWAIQVTGA